MHPTYHLVIAPTLMRAAVAGYRTNETVYVVSPRTLKQLDPTYRFNDVTIIGTPTLTAAQGHQITGQLERHNVRSGIHSDRIWDLVEA